MCFSLRRILPLFLILAFSQSLWAITLEEYESLEVISRIPPGNRNASLPPLPRTVAERNNGSLAFVSQKFQNALVALKSDRVDVLINQIAPLYGVDPLLVLGAIIGEHSFNTQIVMNGQNAYMSMVAGWVSAFSSNSVNLAELVRRMEFSRCQNARTDYERWICNSEVWNQTFRGRRNFPDKSLRIAFFNPVRAGHTFGIGQLDPLRALMVADRVAAVTRSQPINIENPASVYRAILDPRQGMHYISANVALIVEAYRQRAHIDISSNVGIVATLYNLGGEHARALELRNRNIQRLRSGETTLFPPVENYYGWFVNSKEAELRRWLNQSQAAN